VDFLQLTASESPLARLNIQGKGEELIILVSLGSGIFVM
jgi:TctA family transporter